MGGGGGQLYSTKFSPLNDATVFRDVTGSCLFNLQILTTNDMCNSYTPRHGHDNMAVDSLAVDFF